jgi:hypothetical protein
MLDLVCVNLPLMRPADSATRVLFLAAWATGGLIAALSDPAHAEARGIRRKAIRCRRQTCAFEED